MTDNGNFGFARLVPGFDFLQNLAKGGAQNIPQMPNLSSWIAPTLNVEELDKRITELKAVHFWLEQNGKALGATIQALEVQKMTLATLQGMNFNMGAVADALKLKPAQAMASSMQGMSDAAGAAMGAPARKSAATKAAAGAKDGKAGAESRAKPKAGDGGPATAGVDPLQWWGALTQQFQEIAANAMKDVAQKTTADPARKTTAAPAPAAPAPAPAAAKKKSGARKAAPRKTRAKA